MIMKNLKSQVSALLNQARSFEKDEDGIESIQVVMILAFVVCQVMLRFLCDGTHPADDSLFV